MFSDRSLVCRPFFFLMRERKEQVGRVIDILQYTLTDKQTLKEAKEDYGNVARCINAMSDTWNQLTDRNLTWLKGRMKDLPSATQAWVKEQGFNV